MSSRRYFRFAAGVLLTLAASLLLGCGGAESAGTASTAARPPATEPRYGGTVVLGTFSEPVLFNPLYSADSPSGDVETLVFAGLMRIDERLEVVPRLAEAQPEVSADGTVWTYRLRPGITFHDGMPLTAHDVAFTFSIGMSPDYTGPRSGSFRQLASVEAVDELTVRFTLTEPDARFANIAAAAILPRHLLEDIPVAELGDYRAFNERPIGAGPFKFVNWARGQNLGLEAFEDYYDGRPYLDRVLFRFVGNQSAGILLLETGEIDHLVVPASEAATVEQMANVELHSVPQLAYSYIGWNLRNPLFADKRVRQALTHAVDRQEYIDTILGGHGALAHSPVSPVIAWAYSDDVPKFPYDPARAKALLAEAGWAPGADGVLQKDGVRFSFTLLSNDGNEERRDLAVIVQQYLGAVGVEVKPAQLEWGAFLGRTAPPRWDFDAVILSWNLGVDPDPGPLWHSREIAQGLNSGAFRNARVDELADASRGELDRSRRAAMIQEVSRIVADEQPYMFINYPDQLIALRSDVRGFVQQPRARIYGIEKWWLDR